MLSSIDPNHYFFHKGYVPSEDDSKYTRYKKREAIDYSNDDGFFDGLPTHSSSSNSSNSKPQFPLRERNARSKQQDGNNQIDEELESDEDYELVEEDYSMSNSNANQERKQYAQGPQHQQSFINSARHSQGPFNSNHQSPASAVNCPQDADINEEMPVIVQKDMIPLYHEPSEVRALKNQLSRMKLQAKRKETLQR